MRILVSLTFLLLMSARCHAGNQQLLLLLDSAISQRAQFMESKEKRIDYLRKKLATDNDGDGVLKIIDDLFNEFHVFKFDSAMSYADRGLELARRLDNRYYVTLFTLHKADILAIGGLYSEAIERLNSLEPESIDEQLAFSYNMCYFTTYQYWSNYCSDSVFAPQYQEVAKRYMKAAMPHLSANDPLHDYYMGELHVFVEPDSKLARDYYLKVVAKSDEESRGYAMASFALAGNYNNDGDEDRYKEYLIRAALSDLKSCTMENMALQRLAVLLFQQDEKQIERAERYINLSMEDAKFYNNRLRILEISRIMPQIMSSYQETVERQNRNLRFSVVFISLLVMGLLCTAYFIHRQNRKLTARRKELAENNVQLKSLNQQLAQSNSHQAELNDQLKELNHRLVETNSRREGLASIYIDLCARYIDKLGKYQTLVKRKIKANQANELLQTMSSARISEEDAATFLHRFDKAFLELYPTFVEDFNALLHEEGRILLKSPYTMTTELRTFALIRLGVKSTSDIAGLLFLSNQTIYNCRSVIKAKALNRETFDDDVLNLCKVI